MTDKPDGKLRKSFIIRNAMVGLGSLLSFCLVDYYYVTCGESSFTGWADAISLPAYFIVMLWVNRNLYQGQLSGAPRLAAALLTAIAIAWAMIVLLILPAICFHGSIGGQL
jgi:hypothetical protein